jgi:signal transduction histidine kinase
MERLLARLRFDLHDGPQQDVHLLATDLQLFRRQLEPILADHSDRARIMGRLSDLAAQLEALDGSLRRMSTTFQSPFFTTSSLPEAIEEIAGSFASRTGIRPKLRLSGDLTGLTDSQQLGLLALIREALTNVGEHSAARGVSVTVSAGPQGIAAEVMDDGRGFDPDTTLVEAARDGHLGLVGMYERIHMLGGRTDIESRPGGPTVISVKLPPWPPPDGEAG